MMALAQAQALVDEIMGYPEHASFWCPVLTSARLKELLAVGSPHVYARDGVMIWLSAGAYFVLYAARTPELLANHVPAALAQLEVQAHKEGTVIASIYTTTRTATEAFKQAGFREEADLQRLRLSNPQILPPDPNVRAMREDDIPLLAEVGLHAFPENEWTPELWENPLRNAQHAWVATVDGKPAGFLLSSDMTEFSLITGLAVDPAYQGHGLGKALVRHAASEAAKAGLRGVEVHANDRPAALATYKAAGFHIKHPAWAMTRTW